MNFAEASKNITIIDVLYDLGYLYDKTAGNKYPRYIHPDGIDKICIVNAQSQSPGFFNQHDPSDKGSLYRFIESRIEKGIIPKNDTDTYQAIIKYAASIQNISSMDVDILSFKPQSIDNATYIHKTDNLLPLSNKAYLYSRKIFDNDINDILFIDRVFNAAKYVTNIVFPLYDADNNIQGLEYVNKGYKQKEKGSNRTSSIWRSNNPDVTRNIVITENPIDAISCHILKGKPKDTLYISTQGTVSPGQIETISKIRKLNNPNSSITLSFDNDDSGRLFDLVFIENILSSHNVKMSHTYHQEMDKVDVWINDQHQNIEDLKKIFLSKDDPANEQKIIRLLSSLNKIDIIINQLSEFYNLNIKLNKSIEKDFNDDLKRLRI